MKRKLSISLIVVVATAVVFGLGFIAAQYGDPAFLTVRYPLLSRAILGDNTNDILINFVNLRMELNADFSQLPASVDRSFYFEYLPDGTDITEAGDDELVAASLIKVPLVMNLYRAAELHLINLNQTVTVTKSELDDEYGDLYKKGAGYKLTLKTAAAMALERSDDTATHVIYDHVNGLLSPSQQSLASLDIPQNFADDQAVITARDYTSILKGLYYSAFLTMPDSETVLGYLTHSTENKRLTADIPKSVVVAHKNGVNNTNWAQSDCGIVYVPHRPYAICVMVGMPDKQADTFIAKVSKQVYDYVVRQ